MGNLQKCIFDLWCHLIPAIDDDMKYLKLTCSFFKFLDYIPLHFIITEYQTVGLCNLLFIYLFISTFQWLLKSNYT
jgi:hypothetical protein